MQSQHRRSVKSVLCPDAQDCVASTARLLAQGMILVLAICLQCPGAWMSTLHHALVHLGSALSPGASQTCRRAPSKPYNPKP